LGIALVVGRNLVPQPPAGITALRISITLSFYTKPSPIGKPVYLSSTLVTHHRSPIVVVISSEAK
jgi:hypothetical protein